MTSQDVIQTQQFKPFDLETGGIWTQIAMSCDFLSTKSLIIDVEQLPSKVVELSMISFKELGKKYKWILETLRCEDGFIAIGDPHNCKYYMQWTMDYDLLPSIKSCVFNIHDNTPYYQSQNHQKAKTWIRL